MLQIQHRVRGHMNIVLLSSSSKEVGNDIGLIKLVSQDTQSGRGKLLLAKRLSSKVRTDFATTGSLSMLDTCEFGVSMYLCSKSYEPTIPSRRQGRVSFRR